MKQYLVDAFTDKPFAGNPAAVCVMDSWLPERAMQKLAMENNLSETAFLVPEGEGYGLRWFTPAAEEALCGHATLASSFVVLGFYHPAWRTVTFYTRSGRLTVTKQGDLFEMNFPTFPLREVPVTEEMALAYGARPVKAILGLDLTCVFEDEDQVRTMVPDQKRLGALPGRVQNATAPGRDVDCVSRSFCPKDGIAEDPVCGSAHCQIGAYWAGVLQKNLIRAYQASARGGYLECELLSNGRMALRGKAVLVAETEILADLSAC